MSCPGENEDFHPLRQCECADIDDIKQEVYPEWATQCDIDNAEREGMEHYWVGPEPEPMEWPMCNPTPMCSMDTYFNALACTCWPFASYCYVECGDGMKRDPRADSCECIPDPEFEGLFPEWANEDDIELSMIDQFTYPEPEPCPEPWIEPEELIEVPENWPQCEPTDDCAVEDMNLLACQCFATFNCYNFCYDGIHIPITGCECISWDEYKDYFPEEATWEDIATSELLFD